MPKTTDENASSKRLILGFDGGCYTCSELARRIREQVGEKLEVLNLQDPQVREWRAEALGESAPWAPVLFEVEGDKVQAWTGRGMGIKLGRALGPAGAWRVTQVLGEVAANGESARAGEGMSRGRFLKGVGGAATAMGLLSIGFPPGGGLVVPAEAAPRLPGGSTKRTGDEAVGASIAYPAEWVVEREEHTFEDTYGFTIWARESGSTEDHGGEPAVRVARSNSLQPGQIERRVREKLASYPRLPIKRQQVLVGEKGYKGVAIGPIPGSTPSTEIYVPVDGRVYQINVYGLALSSDDIKLLRGLRFERPGRSIDSLGLPDGKKSETYQRKGDAKLIEREQAAKKAAGDQAGSSESSSFSTMDYSATSVPSYNEYQIYEGCWTATSTYFFQTQHGMYANGSGWTQLGIPNYWNEYTHGSLGYGRCISPYYTNDKFAIDYPLRIGDVVFSPFYGGTVTFAGRNYTHKNYGIFVTIKADNGKYVSMAGHLSALAYGIYRGARVTYNSIIGYAGDTGDPSIPVGQPHLHQAFYRYPQYNPDGSPYGGAGLQVIYHHYTGVGHNFSPGVYRYGWTASSSIKAKYSWVSN